MVMDLSNGRTRALTASSRTSTWGRLHRVLEHDDIYFGSSRMLELLVGVYDPLIDLTIVGAWEPAEGRPLHATWVDHVSLVTWSSVSDEAARRKAMHFRGLV